ncbi:hypothetical protein ACWELJ_25885 [Nocardia sp. NPDC004582]
MTTESVLSAALFDASGEWLPEHGYEGHWAAFQRGWHAAYRKGVTWDDQAPRVIETAVRALEKTGCAECVAWARLKYGPGRLF